MPPKGDPRWHFFEGEDLAQNIESGIFYATKNFKGMPNLFKTTRQTDKRKAKKELPGLLKAHLERWQDGKRAAGHSPTVGAVIDEIYATDKDRKPLRKKTKSKRKFYFERIRSEMGLAHIPIERLDLPLWTSRLEKVRAKRDRKTYWDYVKMANIIIKHAYSRKYISHYITFPNPDGPRAEGVVFQKQELEHLWAEMGETMRDQFVLAYECCMRKTEALHLTWDRVDLETGEITLRKEHVKTGSKTNKGRQFIMTPNALERLRRRKAGQKKESRWVFPSPTGRGPVDDNKLAWNNAKDAVLKKHPAFQHWGTYHHLRHTAITQLLVVVGVNVTKVSEYVGTSVATLQRVYLHSRAEHTRGITESLMIEGAECTRN